MRVFLLALMLLLALSDAGGAQEPALARGVRAFQARRYAEARSALGEAARTAPSDATAALYLGRIELLEGDAAAAAKWLERAVEHAPRSGEAHRWLGRAYARQARRVGRLQQARLAGRIRHAFETAVALEPDDVQTRRDLFQFYLLAPRFVGGGHDKAERQARELARRSAMYGRVAAGWLAEAKGDVAGARREFEAAAAAFPDSAAPLLALGALEQRRKQWGAAIAAYDRLLARVPRADEALYQIGRAAALSGTQLEKGAAALERYLATRSGEDEPPLASAHERLATIREHQGDRAAARAHYQEALRLDPGMPEAREGMERVK